MYEGMSYVQLYRNRACTELIPQDTNGNYVLNLGVISNNAHNPYTFNIFAKNIGTHKSYDVNVTNISEGCSTTFLKCDILPGQVKLVTLLTDIDVNQTAPIIVTFKLEFDSV